MSSGAATDLTSDAFVFFGATGDLAWKGGSATARAVVASEQDWQDPKREDTAPC
jgi:hypothetical protein